MAVQVLVRLCETYGGGPSGRNKKACLCILFVGGLRLIDRQSRLTYHAHTSLRLRHTLSISYIQRWRSVSKVVRLRVQTAQ